MLKLYLLLIEMCVKRFTASWIQMPALLLNTEKEIWLQYFMKLSVGTERNDLCVLFTTSTDHLVWNCLVWSQFGNLHNVDEHIPTQGYF